VLFACHSAFTIRTFAIDNYGRLIHECVARGGGSRRGGGSGSGRAAKNWRAHPPDGSASLCARRVRLRCAGSIRGSISARRSTCLTTASVRARAARRAPAPAPDRTPSPVASSHRRARSPNRPVCPCAGLTHLPPSFPSPPPSGPQPSSSAGSTTCPGTRSAGPWAPPSTRACS
jgi:hypothetical protein